MKQPILPAIILLASLGIAPLAHSQVNYRIDNFAGTAGVGDGGPAAQALLAYPLAVAVDAQGGYYIADTLHRRIRYVNSSGNISTILDHTEASKSLGSTNLVSDLALDAQGRLYFSDSESCVVVRREQSGSLTVVAGIVQQCSYNGVGGSAAALNLNNPTGIAFGPDGALYISDTNNDRIRKVIIATGVMSTIAGTGAISFGGNGSAVTTTIVRPVGLAVDAGNNIYVAEAGYRRVRVISSLGLISTLAGTGFEGNSGDGGPGLQATFQRTSRIALDSVRNRLFVGDPGANRVRVVDLSTRIITAAAGLASMGAATSFSGDGGVATLAGLAAPRGMAVEPSGNLLIADERNNRIRRLDLSGTIRIVAGRWPLVRDGTAATSAELDNRGFGRSLAVDSTGAVYIIDRNMLTVRRVDKNGIITTHAGLPIDQLPSNTSYGISSGDGASAKLAKFGNVDAIATDSSNNLYVADGTSLRRVDASTATISKIATLLGGTIAMSIDSVNRAIYLVARNTNGLYKIDLTAASPVPQLIAGTPGTAGFAGDGAQASAALFSAPQDVAVDSQGRVLIADFYNGRIRRIGADGRIASIAGNGTDRALGVALLTPGTALATGIGPIGLAVETNGNILFAEGRAVLRMLDSATGQIRAIAGTGIAGSSGDGGAASAATLDLVDSVAVDSAGAVYLLDSSNRVRVLRPVIAPSSLQLNGGNNQSGLVGTTLATPLSVRVLLGTVPFPGASVEFRVTSGAATLSPASALSGANGIASTNVTLGSAAGPIVVTATIGTLPAISFSLTATSAPNPNRPVLGAAGSVATAGAYGGGTVLAPGSWIEIYGSNLSATSREWEGTDFNGARAPTSLDGVNVSIGGKPAFIWYISPGQLNVQVPDGIATGDALIVTTAQGSSAPYMIVAALRTPAVLAPPAFKVNGVQYAAALLPDRSFVGPTDLIAGLAFRPAKPGETIVLHGVGFGATDPFQPAGQVVAGAANLPAVLVQIGGVSAQVTFAGLVANTVGLYQLNVVVPDIPAGDVPLTIQVAGVLAAQRLTISVGTP